MTRFRRVNGPAYVTAVCVLWVLTFILGAWIYSKYRIYIRIPIEHAGFRKTERFFEMKEHVVSLGLGLLPIYWCLWKDPKNPEYNRIRLAGDTPDFGADADVLLTPQQPQNCWRLQQPQVVPRQRSPSRPQPQTMWPD